MKVWLPESAAQHVHFDAVVEQGKKQVLQTLLDTQQLGPQQPGPQQPGSQQPGSRRKVASPPRD
jgi:hypothetical protein